MLKISREQIADLEREVMVEEIRDIARYLRVEHTEAVAAVADEELLRRVAKGVARAQAYGMEWDSTITAFVAIMFEVAPTFDEQPAIRDVLRDRRIPADTRIDALWDRTTDEDWDEAERMADQAEAFWNEA